jgi:hypothetical protein
VGADRPLELCRFFNRAGKAEVDEPRRDVHDDVARLDVEVHDFLAGQVMENAGDVQRERKELLEGKRAVALDETA